MEGSRGFTGWSCRGFADDPAVVDKPRDQENPRKPKSWRKACLFGKSSNKLSGQDRCRKFRSCLWRVTSVVFICHDDLIRSPQCRGRHAHKRHVSRAVSLPTHLAGKSSVRRRCLTKIESPHFEERPLKDSMELTCRVHVETLVCSIDSKGSIAQRDIKLVISIKLILGLAL